MTHPIVEQLVRELVEITAIKANKAEASPRPKNSFFTVVNETDESLFVSISRKVGERARAVVCIPITLKEKGDFAKFQTLPDDWLIVTPCQNDKHRFECQGVAELADRTLKIHSALDGLIPSISEEKS